MKKERFKIESYAALVLRKEGKILLIRRSNTGRMDGFYSCAGGAIDGNEPVTCALIREASEEIGILLKQEHLRVVHVLHAKREQDLGETIGFFVEATSWEGEPQNMEPHKHDEVAWFALHELPENTLPTLKHVLEMVNKNIFYSETGWD